MPIGKSWSFTSRRVRHRNGSESSTHPCPAPAIFRSTVCLSRRRNTSWLRDRLSSCFAPARAKRPRRIVRARVDRIPRSTEQCQRPIASVKGLAAVFRMRHRSQLSDTSILTSHVVLHRCFQAHPAFFAPPEFFLVPLSRTGIRRALPDSARRIHICKEQKHRLRLGAKLGREP